VLKAGSVCDQRTSKFFVPCGRIYGSTRGYKWNLLKVREGKYKGKHGETQEDAGRQMCVFLLSGALKTYDNLWEGENRRFPSNNERSGRGMGGSQPGEGVPEPKHG
jgi:hypothetical protein